MHILDRQTRTYEQRYEHRIVGFGLAVLKLYVTYAIGAILFLFLLGIVGGLIANALYVPPAHAAETATYFSWRCAGLNFACSPSTARLRYSPLTIAHISEIVKAVDADSETITDPVVKDAVETMSQVDERLPSTSTQEPDMIKEMLLHHRLGIPTEDMVWLSMTRHPEIGLLVVRTTSGDYCACIDRDGNLKGPLLAGDYLYFEDVIHEDVP